MSTATEIERLTTARNTIRNKMVELGLSTSTAKIDALATAVSSITNRGSVSATVTEGSTYTIPAGYHNGSGTVSGVGGGGNYSLQSKTATPTKSQQNITPDSGYYGLSDVTVAAIPEAYQDVSSVTAAAGDVLATKVFVTAAGDVTAGTMPNNGAVSQTLDVRSGHTSYTVPAGYHSGSGTVSLVTETKTATPTTAAQNITPTDGKVLSQVTVNAIPAQYANVSDADAVAANILSGKIAYSYDSANDEAVKITGTMANKGSVTAWIYTNTALQRYKIPAGYHDGNGHVDVAHTTKTVTPTTSTQIIDGNIGGTNTPFLTSVTVNPIPAAYQDITNVDAVAGNVLAGKVFVDSTGEVTGTMPNNGAISATIDGLTTTSYSVPSGYTSGGTVSLTSDIENALAAI